LKKRLFLFLLFSLFSSCKDKPAKGLGLTTKNQFFPCPKNPNCVSSFENPKNEKNFIRPIKFLGQKETIIKKLVTLIENNPNAKIVERKENYIRAEYTSSFFKFVDDIQFYFGKKNIIHIKSSSRVGYSDFGKNKQRVEEIELTLQQESE